MSKFVVVNKMPAQLGKNEVAFTQPDFMEQIAETSRRGARRTTTGVNQLRDIVLAIQKKYGIDLDIFRIPFTNYEGLPFESDQDISHIITTLLRKERPDVFEKILEYNIKTRPYGTKLIYYVGNHPDTGPFFQNGIDMLDEKEVDEFLGRKPKKIVGKPAVSKEQSEESAS